MKLSWDWLSDFVDLQGLTAQEVADKLTMGAFEVEEITVIGPKIEGQVVVGEIMEIHPHPNADKIRLTKTRIAEGEEPQEIVCGAWNIEVGHKIPVALPGSKVINRHDGSTLEIKQSKIRGVTSNGMLCSAPELGIEGSGEGILLLDPSTKLGTDAREVLGIRNDFILHVEPRSNRGDALSVLGLAREVAALFGRPLKKAEWQEEFKSMQECSESKLLQLEIEDQNDCPYFTVRTLSDIKIGPSPALISRRLEAVGVKSINNVVDITNYVLHELGQPLHAYDMKHISGDKLWARRARAEEKLTTIDQKERQLNPDALVIADQAAVLGVAGVMGGKMSEVSDATEIVALEAASFASGRVRRSSRVLGLSSDSSLRFERGVDTAQVRAASDRASYLMVKHCGAKLGRMATAGSGDVPAKEVKMRMSELKRICEIDMITDAAAELLEPLGFKSKLSADDYNAGVLTVLVPSFRQRDVYREIDLIEEVCRLYGFDRLPVSMPASTIAAQTPDPLPGKVRSALSAAGISEAWISSLTSYEELAGRKSFQHNAQNANCQCEDCQQTNGNAVAVMNPLSPEHQVLRQSLLPGLIKAASYNQDRGNSNPCLFELGKIYRKDPRRINKQAPAHKQTGTHEEMMVSAVVCGESKISQWRDSDKQDDNGRSYYLIKGIFENLLTSLKIPAEAVKYQNTDELPGWLHPHRAAACVVDTSILEGSSDNNGNKKKKSGNKKGEFLLGYIGEIHPAIANAYRLSGRAALLELSMAALADARVNASFAEIYNTQAMQRDLTVDIDHAVNHQQIESGIKAGAGEMLKKVELVSVFRLSETQKSLSYRLTFQHASETLKAEAVDAIIAKVRDELSKRLNASFRI